MTADGFDVHHIDGNKENNNPDNLVLIEHADHMRLHGMGTVLRRIGVQPKRKKKAKASARRTRYDHRKCRHVLVSP